MANRRDIPKASTGTHLYMRALAAGFRVAKRGFQQITTNRPRFLRDYRHPTTPKRQCALGAAQSENTARHCANSRPCRSENKVHGRNQSASRLKRLLQPQKIGDVTGQARRARTQRSLSAVVAAVVPFVQAHRTATGSQRSDYRSNADSHRDETRSSAEDFAMPVANDANSARALG